MTLEFAVAASERHDAAEHDRLFQTRSVLHHGRHQRLQHQMNMVTTT